MGSSTSPSFSFEFFPPRTDAGVEKLDTVHQELAALGPDYFSVTYGAGGSTRDGTLNTVLRYQKAGSDVAPHLSFGGADDESVLELLRRYQEAGIRRLVALRGDLPSGAGSSSNHRYASELVRFVRQHTGDHFHIEVACYPETHPEAKNYSADVDYFRQKIDAGANGAITQYFYNADAYFYFLEQCCAAGISAPIVPGIMPIINAENLARFSNACGAEIPRWLGKRLAGFGEDSEGLREFGVEVVTSLCQRLLAGGAPGLHFYSMNQAASVSQIWRNLGLDQRSAVKTGTGAIKANKSEPITASSLNVGQY